MKTQAQYKAEADAQQRKYQAELEKLAPKFPVPDGFTTEWRDNYLGCGWRVFVMTKPNDTEFIFLPGGSGTTNFETKDGRRTFDRRGVDDSFYWKGYSFFKRATKRPLADVKQILDEQLERIAKSRTFHETALKVPQIGHSVSPDALTTYKAKLKAGKHITFTPSGFGTGYNVVTRKPARPWWGVQRATPELEKFFDHSPLWVESFDCD